MAIINSRPGTSRLSAALNAVKMLAVLLLLLSLPIRPARADLTPAVLDTGFDPGTGANNSVYATAVQHDGKVVIGGMFTQVDGTTRNYVARLDADGSLDTTFDPGTGPNNWVLSAAPQDDGKVFIGGYFTAVDGMSRNRIARLNADGSLDTSFYPGTAADNYVFAVAPQPDGKVIIGGAFTSVDGTGRNRIARLNADGSLDTSFDPGTGANGAVYAVAIQPDGKVIIGGEFTTIDGDDRHFLARLNANGSLDAGFDTGSSLNDGPSFYVYAVALQPEGKVLVGGDFYQVDGVARSRIARMNANGSLDTTFNPGGGADGRVRGIDLDSDGNVVIGGQFTQVDGTARNYIARLEDDGSLDIDFDPGSGSSSYVLDLAVQPVDGKVVIGGQFTSVNGVSRNRIARLNADGSVDTGFDAGSGTNNYISAMVLQPDGRMLIGGGFTNYDGTTRIHVARLRANGAVDTSFDTSTDGPNDSVRALALQPDGKVLIGGSFTMVGSTPITRVARLDADGSLDTSFDPGGGVNGDVYAVGLQPDGKVLVGGSFTRFDGAIRRRIFRLNADGSLDTSFDPGEGAGGVMGLFTSVRAIVRQPDGRVIVGGDFTTVDDVTRPAIARLNANGSLDTSFDPGAGANEGVQAVALQPDGKVVIGGEFTTVNGIPRTYVARLNADGSLDTSFAPGVVTDTVATDGLAWVSAVAIQPDGKVVIGGKFDEVDGTSCLRIARLNADGSLDTAFDASAGASGTVKGVLLQPDGKILVRGSFTVFGGEGVNDIVRINGMTAPTFTSAAPSAAGVDTLYSHTFTAGGFPAPTFRVTSGSLPPGLSLDSVSGVLSGTPTTKGTYAFTVLASNGVAPSATQAVTLQVSERVYLPLVLRDY